MRVCGGAGAGAGAGAGEGEGAGLGCAAALHSHHRRQSRHMQKPCYARVCERKCAGGAHVGNNLAGAFAVDVAGDEHFYCTASCVAGASDEKLQGA
jgi:hypothetical protein